MEEAKTQPQSQKQNLAPAPAQDNDDYQFDGLEDNRVASNTNGKSNTIMDPFVQSLKIAIQKKKIDLDHLNDTTNNRDRKVQKAVSM